MERTQTWMAASTLRQSPVRVSPPPLSEEPSVLLRRRQEQREAISYYLFKPKNETVVEKQRRTSAT